MRRFDAILILTGAALLLLIAVYGVRVAQHYPSLRAELGRVKLMQLDGEVQDRLHEMQHDAIITYYVSRRENLPSSMRRIERDVADILETMKSASGGRLDFQIVHPEDDESFAQHAVHQRVSPFRMRTVTRDSYAEQTVWSTLHIAYGPHPASVVNGVAPDHLPRLQSLIMGQIEQKDDPREPVFGIAADEHNYSQFRRWLSRSGRVLEVDLAQPIPPEVDVLFWFDPGSVPPTIIRRLNEFLADGRSAVIAGSRYDVRQIDGWEFEFSRTNYDTDALLSAFGLRAIDGLVLDQSSLSIPGELAPKQARFMIRCIAHNQDFRAMRGHPNGHLYFQSVTPFALDGDVLAQQGLTPIVLATTSDQTSIADVPVGTVRLDWTEVSTGDPAPKLPLMAWLRPDKPWLGSLVFAASSSAFRNQWFVHENFAHRRLAEVLTDTLASDERLVIHRSGIERPQPLPELGGSQRILWRVFCILAVPLLLGILAFRRGVFRIFVDAPQSKSIGAARSWTNSLALRAGAGSTAVVLLTSLSMALGLRTDLSQGQFNELASESRAIATQVQGDNAVTVNLYFSRNDQLPPSMRPMLRQLRNLLGEFRRAGANLTIMTQFPDDLTSEERDTLDAAGIKPIRSISRDEEMTVVRTIYCTVEMVAGDRRELLHFPDRQSFENLQFRLAFALWRLINDRQPHIAFIADIPRLTAAEVYHDFQQQNLFAPTGSDVHSQARELLHQAGFHVTHVNPRMPSIPEDVDLILWMQPRRDILPVLQQTVDRLHNGTPVMIAAQHFIMQSRQFSGDQFSMVYWPQTQVTDIDRFYFPDIGLRLVHEVLFDEMRAAMAIESQVRQTTAERDYGAQVSALPFLIRAIAPNFDPDHPTTRGLSDQVLPFANHLDVNEEQLASFGLVPRTIITTSNRSWRFNWTGGWLPEHLLHGPELDEDGRPKWKGRLPLAVLVEGAFPLPADPLTDRRVNDERQMKFTGDPGESSQLLFIANSYMFRNDRLFEPEFRADHLLLNAAAFLALGESLARIAGHRHADPGFDYIEPEVRLYWRVFVLGLGPAVLLVFGALWWVGRSMPSRTAVHLRNALH